MFRVHIVAALTRLMRLGGIVMESVGREGNILFAYPLA